MSSGQHREVRIKKNAGAYGALAGATGAKLFTRVSTDIDLKKNRYQSARIKQSQQRSDSRHGTRRGEGTFRDELACGAFVDLFAAVLRTAWAAGATSGAIITVAASATPPHFVRTSGSWITDGFRVGALVRPAGFTTTGAVNNGRNFIITALTALDMTVAEVGEETTTIGAKAAGDSVTFVEAGKTLIVPQSGHTKDDFNMEYLYTDFTPVRSELFVGAVPTGFTISIQPDNMTGVEFPFLAKNRIDAAAEYFTTPAAVDTHRTFGSAIGLLHLYGSLALHITSLNLTVKGNHQSGNPILAPTINKVYPGRVEVEASVSGYLENFTMRDAFAAETEGNMIFFLAATEANGADSFGVVLPRIKVMDNTIADSETNFVENVPIEALENDTATGKDLTTIRLQDTTLS